jgi:hypothetical protein
MSSAPVNCSATTVSTSCPNALRGSSKLAGMFSQSRRGRKVLAGRVRCEGDGGANVLGCQRGEGLHDVLDAVAVR